MKKIALTLALLLSLILGYGQCPFLDITLNNQNDIDNFATNYPNCYELTHELLIDGQFSTINNLDGLYPITGAESIFILNTQIEDLEGLHNLENINHLALWGNGNLINLSGLSSLQTIGFFELFVNSSITNVDGMTSIQSIDNLNLFSNSSLNDISHLSFLETMNSLTIGSNDLSSLNGLENLTTVSGDLNISNEQITNVNELVSIQSIGGSLYIANNDEIQDLSAFSNIETLENLYLLECQNLNDLHGLRNIHTINGKLRIGFNSSLETLAVLDGLISVGDLDIYENENLGTFKGMENLQEIKNRLFINNNPALFSIESIGNVSPEEIDEVAIIVNNSLSICSNPLICSIIDDPSVSKTFFDNAPGCNSENEVLVSCNTWSFRTIDLEAEIELYPNPVSDFLTISLTEGILFKKANLYTISHERIYEAYTETINFSMFPKGIYFVDIETDKGNVVKKIIKD